MPIPSQTKVIPSRRIVRSDNSTKRGPRISDEPSEITVLGHVHSYPPNGLAGAPITLHQLLKRGHERGWKPRIVVDERGGGTWVHDGIPVRRDYNVRSVNLDYTFSQAVITHLHVTPKAMEMSRRAGRPLVHLVHNDHQLRDYRVKRRDCALAIFNSEWLAKDVAWEGPFVVSHPHVAMADYATDGEGECVTLVNLMPSKGAELFYELARRNPGVSFLGVKGYYGRQSPAPDLPNLQILDPQEDMRNAYSRTRILLMPSVNESWGRTAIEAACSGIPTLASKAPGLVESGVAAEYLDLDFEKWNKAVRRYTRGEKVWEGASEAAIAKALELESRSSAELDSACERIEQLI